MNPFSLQGMTILVTGASSGIGRQLCVSAAAMGATIVATGRDNQRLDETLTMMEGSGHRKFAADLTSSEARAELCATISSVNGILHAAGITKHVPFAFLTEKFLRDIWAINYEAPITLTQMLLKKKAVAEHGSIVFMASTAGLFGAKALSAYAGTKGALIATMRVIALEMAPRRIRVNCLAPAMVETPMAVQTEESVSAESMAEHRLLYPLGFGKPEDVANAAIFLLSPASRWITGTTLILDGGYTCR